MNTAFGERLKALRSRAGLTQEALARAAGLSSMTVAKLEHKGGDPSWSTVCKLADALGIDVGAFRGQPEAAPAAKGKGKRGGKG